MRIALIGDVHGHFEVLKEILIDLIQKHGITAAIQTGDFGLLDDSVKIILNGGLPIPLYFIDGNHEDFRFLRRSLYDGTSSLWAEKNLFYQPRSTMVDIFGIKAGFIGGALHVDQPQLRKNGNVITNDDINSSIQLFGSNQPDIIISHSCPAGIGIGMKGQKSHATGVAYYIIMAGYDPGPSDDYGETQLARLWEAMPKKPDIWLFGHFHQFYSKKIENTLFLCLPSLDHHRECLIWDTETGGILSAGLNAD